MATEHQKTAIGGLLNPADELSKKVISAYNPAVKYQTNLYNIKRFDAAHLEAAAAFLGLNVRLNDKKLYKNLSVLSDRVILRIESLFETECTTCGETYCNILADKPILTCYLCLQGCHNCPGVTTKFKETAEQAAGTVWLCSGCLKKNDLTLAPTKKPSVANAAVKEEEEEEEEDEEVDDHSPRRNREEKEADKDETRVPVCQAYKRRECPHGLTGKRLLNGKPCPNRHPPRCFRYCKHGENMKLGCIKGNECKYFHPRLCRNSVSRRVCLNADCTLVHLKFTKRSQDGERKKTTQPKLADNSNTERQLRFSSMGTLSGTTPYNPTIQKRSRAPLLHEPIAENRKEQDSSSFLLKLMENLKDGILLQITDKLQEFQTSIPEMVREEHLKMTRQSVPPPTMYHLPPTQQQMSLAQSALQHHLPTISSYQTQFPLPGCSY